MDDELNPGAGFVGAAACAGEALLRIGLRAQTQGERAIGADNPEVNEDTNDWLDSEIHALAKSAIQRCHGMGGTFEAVGKMVQAAVASARGEIVGAKCVFFSFTHKKCLIELSLMNPFFAQRQISPEVCPLFIHVGWGEPSPRTPTCPSGCAVLAYGTFTRYGDTGGVRDSRCRDGCETKGRGWGERKGEGEGRHRRHVSTDR